MMRRGALLAAVLCLCAGLAVIAHADSIDDLARDEADAAFSARQAQRILDQVLPSPTPTPLHTPAITIHGNVLIPADIAPISVTRDAPLAVIPEKNGCRADAKAAPRGAVVVCLVDDHLYRIIIGDTP